MNSRNEGTEGTQPCRNADTARLVCSWRRPAFKSIHKVSNCTPYCRRDSPLFWPRETGSSVGTGYCLRLVAFDPITGLTRIIFGREGPLKEEPPGRHGGKGRMMLNTRGFK